MSFEQVQLRYIKGHKKTRAKGLRLDMRHSGQRRVRFAFLRHFSSIGVLRNHSDLEPHEVLPKFMISFSSEISAFCYIFLITGKRPPKIHSHLETTTLIQILKFLNWLRSIQDHIPHFLVSSRKEYIFPPTQTSEHAQLFFKHVHCTT